MAYIKKEPIIEFITKGLNNFNKAKAYGYDAIEILTEIEYTPTEDVVEVVRCKDCEHFEAITLDSGISVGFGNCKNEKGINLYPKETDFCSYGVPKERGGEK